MIFRNVLLVLATLCASTAISQAFHTYEVRFFPKVQGESCQTAASRLAEKLADETGVTVFRAECIRDNRDGYDFNIIYNSVEQLRLVTTFKEQGGLGPDGIYVSVDQCQAALSGEKARFERATGLTAFLSYCYRSSPISKTPWAVRLDAFGSANLYPYRFERSIFGRILQGEDRALATINQVAADSNITEPLSIVTHDASETLVIRFFDQPENGQHRLRYFKVEELAKFNTTNSGTTQSHCLSELESIKAQMTTTNPAIWFCTFENMTWISRLHVVQFKPQEKIEIEDAPFTYTTLDECTTDRSSVIAAYRSSGQSVEAGVCSWDDGFWGGQRGTYKLRLVFLR